MASANHGPSGSSRLDSVSRSECIRLQAERVVGAYHALRAAPHCADFNSPEFPVGQFAELVTEIKRLGHWLEPVEAPQSADVAKLQAAVAAFCELPALLEPFTVYGTKLRLPSAIGDPLRAGEKQLRKTLDECHYEGTPYEYQDETDADVDEQQAIDAAVERQRAAGMHQDIPADVDDEPEGVLFLECMREGDDDERHAKYAIVRNPARGEHSLIDLFYSVRAIGNAITQAEGDAETAAGLAGALCVIGAQLERAIGDVDHKDRETLGAMLRAGGAS